MLAAPSKHSAATCVVKRFCAQQADPILAACHTHTRPPSLPPTLQQLRQLNRTWTLADVAQHRYCDDGWIAIDGRVYDITEHIATHPGWSSGCRVTEVLSIIAHLGVDCSTEFHEIHRAYPIAYKQLAAYYIGELEQQ